MMHHQPRIVSLWDMLEFNAERFVRVNNLLMVLQAAMDAAPQGFLDGKQVVMDPKFYDDLLLVRIDLVAMAMPVSVAAIDRVLEEISRPYQYFKSDWLKNRIIHFSTVVGDELRSKTFFTLSPIAVETFGKPEMRFGESVLNAFPSVEYDVREAGRCFALDRHTAVVFHCMRVMEVGLEATAAELGLDIASNWNNALNQIEKEIRNRSIASNGPSWKNDEVFFSEAVTHFRVVKNAWRNHTMHKREVFDEERARSILQSTADFMRHLATRLSE